MKSHVPKVFRITGMSPVSNEFPEFVLKDGCLYRTTFHPNGWSEKPDYAFETDGKFYRTRFHELGFGVYPDYKIGSDRKLYRTDDHPGGQIDTPEFEIRD